MKNATEASAGLPKTTFFNHTLIDQVTVTYHTQVQWLLATACFAKRTFFEGVKAYSHVTNVPAQPDVCQSATFGTK